MSHIKNFNSFLNESNTFLSGSFSPIDKAVKDYIASIEDNYGGSGSETDKEVKMMRDSLESFASKYEGFMAREVEDDNQREELFKLLSKDSSKFKKVSGKGSEIVKVADYGNYLVAVHGDENFLILKK